MFVTMITPENRLHFAREWDQVGQLRHQTFNEWLGWDLPHQNGREYDKYDAASLHMVALDETNSVLGTWRLMPTTRPFMTDEVFPELIEELGPVASPAIWDLSRFAINRVKLGTDEHKKRTLFASMASAMFEFGIMNGVAEYLSVQNNYITPLANHFLGDPVWQSQTVDMGATDATCYSYQPSLERLYALRNQFALQTPVLSQFQISDYKRAA